MNRRPESADKLQTSGVVIVRVDFVGSKRELSNANCCLASPSSWFSGYVMLGRANPPPPPGGLVGAVIAIPIPSRSRKSLSSAIGRQGMKDQFDAIHTTPMSVV
jgi:hypothetical protein